MFGIDGTSSGDLAALKKAGVRFVCRYLSTDGNPKNLTAAEARRLEQAGLQIVTVYETTGTDVKEGYQQGLIAARRARDQLAACGAPKTAPVFFAVDYDAPPADQPAINGYLKAAGTVLGPDRVGVYGGYNVVKRALEAGACRYGWQTYAWSGGLWHPGAHLRQYRNAQHLGGITCDFDVAMARDFGQWSPPRLPVPKLKPTFAVQAFDKAGHVVKAWTTRTPALSLAKWNIARHRPAKVEIDRLNQNV